MQVFICRIGKNSYLHKIRKQLWRFFFVEIAFENEQDWAFKITCLREPAITDLYKVK